jgi:hypothetical protein
VAIVVSDTSPIRALAHLNLIQQEIGFFISPALRREALRLAGEVP